MRYEMLGPLRVRDENTYFTLHAQKVEMVLTVLLIRADHLVFPEQLMREIWGENLPRRAASGLHVYVSRLRKFLKLPGASGNPVETRTPGYVLHKGDDQIDAQIFPELVDVGRSLLREQRTDEAASWFSQALALWRGPIPGHSGDGTGAKGPIIGGFSTWLTEIRRECQEMLVECQLQLGRHREAVSMLYALTAENPMCEAFHRQLMLALYRSERQADALKVYQSVRKTLNDELGLEPGRPLQDLQRAILSGDMHLMSSPLAMSDR